MDRVLGSLAKDIEDYQNLLYEKSRQVLEDNDHIKKKTKILYPSLSVCAVDGGILSFRVHGSDLVVARAVGVNFIYDNGKLYSFSYYPSKKPSETAECKSGLNEREAAVFGSLFRLKIELSCAISTIQKFDPDLFLIDGSLLPLPSDKPSEESELTSLYSEVVSLYESLFSLCKEKNCVLAGIIKDSRSKVLASELGLSCSDSVLCNHLLQPGERTIPKYYAGKGSFPGNKIKFFYLKSSAQDIPLRIEVLDFNDFDEKSASLVYSLSSISDRFAYPAILIEADMCAAFDSKEHLSFQYRILSISGADPLRRNSRPFR